ncbi:MAG: ribonuclease H-like domain-containing protein [Finegoldia sp.]|nr:ribonuclease H-like domain-containing protein [Finegoldia sp.]
MKEKTAYLSIETTGINRNKNHIYLIGIYTNETSYSFYAKNESDEEKIVRSSYKILKDKQIISYKGTSFALPFLNSKLATYGIYDFYKSYFDPYLFLKSYYKNPFSDLRLQELAKDEFEIELLDKKELIKDYKLKRKEGTISLKAIEENKKSLKAGVKILSYIKNEIIAKNLKNYRLGEIDLKVFLYKFKVVKNNLVIYLFYDGDFEIDMIKSYAVLVGKDHKLEITLPLYEGKIKDDIYSCVKTDMENSYDLVDNLYPVIKNNEFMEENIETLISYILN